MSKPIYVDFVSGINDAVQLPVDWPKPHPRDLPKTLSIPYKGQRLNTGEYGVVAQEPFTTGWRIYFFWSRPQFKNAIETAEENEEHPLSHARRCECFESQEEALNRLKEMRA